MRIGSDAGALDMKEKDIDDEFKPTWFFVLMENGKYALQKLRKDMVSACFNYNIDLKHVLEAYKFCDGNV